MGLGWNYPCDMWSVGCILVELCSECSQKESSNSSNNIADEKLGAVVPFDDIAAIRIQSAFRAYKEIRTHAIRRAHENIDKTLKAAEVILAKFDISRQAEAMIVKGPREDVESYLGAIEQLRGNIKVFSNNKSFKSSLQAT